MKRPLLTCVMALSCTCSSAFAQSSDGVQDGDIFHAEIYAASAEVRTTAAIILEMYYTHMGEEIPQEDATHNGNLFDFYFASGPGLISNERVQPEALVGFSRETKKALGDLSTNSDECFVQGLIDSNMAMILTISSHVENDADRALYCLVAGLWRHKHGSLRGFDSDSNWREALRDVIEG